MTASIQQFLCQGGMPPADSFVATKCPEGSLAITYEIITPQGRFFLKLHDSEGARGGFGLKHLLPLCDPEVRRHAELRRKFVRKLLDYIVLQRSTLVPKPLFFDLKERPMTAQRQAAQESVVAELRMEAPHFRECVGTLWAPLDIAHLPTLSPDKRDFWNPTHYSPENVARCTAAIGEIQTYSEQFLEAAIARKVAAGKGTRDEIYAKLSCKLAHEQRALTNNYPYLVEDLFDAFGKTLEVHVLQSFGREVLVRVYAQVREREGDSLKQLKADFLAGLPIPPEYAEFSFQRLMFTAERERLWDGATRLKGKALDRMEQAETLGLELLKNPERIVFLLTEVRGFRETYEHLQRLPRAIVPQDGHPFNFFIHQADGETAMLDLEDMSMDVRFADLARIYTFRIMRDWREKKITREEVLVLLKAVVEGYNSKAPTPLTQEELGLFGAYAKAAFLNFLPQFGIILRMDPRELDRYNLAMSMEAFWQQFAFLQKVAKDLPTLFSIVASHERG